MDQDESYRYHERALARDPLVSSELWERLHAPLFRRLRPTFGGLDTTDVEDAITDVILEFCEHPERYNPDKRTLDGYLAMAARGDLLNLLEKRKRLPKIVPLPSVEHDDANRNREQEVEDAYVDDYLPDAISEEALLKKLRDILPDPTDREVYEMMADGVRETTRYARVLGCEELDPAAQRKLVKQVKDRIRIRLKRSGLTFDA